MAIESHLPSRENPSPTQSQSDATSAPQSANGHVEARETDTDNANKEIAKPATTITDQNGAPIDAPDEEAIPTPEAEPDPELDVSGGKPKTDIGTGY